MPSNSLSRRACLGLAGGLCAATLAACGSGGESASAHADGLDTLDPGVIHVAIEAYAPYTSMEGGKMVGLDADILNAAAGKLGLKVEPEVTDFNGMLGGVQSHRVDLSIGGIAWSAERQQQGRFTDPVYYSPPAMAVHGDATYHTIADLEGKSLGTVTGYVWVKSIQAIPGATLHAYPNASGVFDDLSAGRIQAGFLDPFIMIAAKQANPSFDFTTQYLTPPTQAQIKAKPDLQYLAPYQVAFYVAKQEPKLEAALSKQIDKMYTDGELTALIKKYGGDPQQFLQPTPEMSTQRQGVDRPKGWKAPKATS
ncbi:MAG: amino acid ABC transporter substrate-binding protein [Acidimicrobiaceae bacterium]|nr:amino acid ABC transporter substrate-binding protein [Acidimicrobiaceae bacterium]